MFRKIMAREPGRSNVATHRAPPPATSLTYPAQALASSPHRLPPRPALLSRATAFPPAPAADHLIFVDSNQLGAPVSDGLYLFQG